MMRSTRRSELHDAADAEVAHRRDAERFDHNNHQSDLQSFFSIFALDFRSIALFRVVIAIAVMWDTISGMRDVYAFYANLGVWPVIDAIANSPEYTFSLYFANGTTQYQIALMFITVIAAFSMMIGFRTRFSSFVVWLLVLSRHNRNMLIINHGDDFLRLLLFWAIFLPLGATFSVDCAHANVQPANFYENHPRSKRFLHFSGFAIVAQFVCFFWVEFVLKTGEEWENGSALYYALSIDQMTTSFGYFLLRFPLLLKLLTHLYLWAELLIPLLICFPLAHELMRLIAVCVIVFLHAGLGMSLQLGMYAWAPAIGSLALLPRSFWDSFFPNRVARHLLLRTGAPRGLILYFDGEAGHAQTAANLICMLAGVSTPVVSAQSATVETHDGGPTLVSDMRTHRVVWSVMDSSGRKFFGARAILLLLEESYYLACLAPFLDKLKILNRLTYRLIAETTYYTLTKLVPAAGNFTEKPTRGSTQIATPTWRKYLASRLPFYEILSLLAITYVAWWNIGSLRYNLAMPHSLQSVGHALRIDQFWSTLAPYPMKDDGWFMIPAILANNKDVDLWTNGGLVVYTKPAMVSKTFPNDRWRRYMMNLWLHNHHDTRLFYGRYLCRQWNWYGDGANDADYELKSFKLVYMREITLANYRLKGPEQMVLWEHTC